MIQGSFEGIGVKMPWKSCWSINRRRHFWSDPGFPEIGIPGDRSLAVPLEESKASKKGLLSCRDLPSRKSHQTIPIRDI